MAQGELKKFNTDIWDNKEILSLSGYPVTMIKEPLYQLAQFIQENLSPNRLEGFDIEDIKTLQDTASSVDGSSNASVCQIVITSNQMQCIK